jgi:hypothetical protein
MTIKNRDDIHPGLNIKCTLPIDKLKNGCRHEKNTRAPLALRNTLVPPLVLKKPVSGVFFGRHTTD